MCLAGESRVARSLPPRDPVRLPVLNRMSDDDGTAPCIARCIRTYWMGSIPSATESSLDDVRFLFSMSRQASIVLASTTPSKCTWYGVKPSCAEPLLRGHVCLLHPVVGAAGRLCLGPLICDDRRRLRDLKGLALARAGALCVVVRHALTLQASTIRPQVAMSIFTLSWPFRWPTAMGSTPSCVAVYVDHEPYAAPTRASSSLGKPECAVVAIPKVGGCHPECRARGKRRFNGHRITSTYSVPPSGSWKRCRGAAQAIALPLDGPSSPSSKHCQTNAADRHHEIIALCFQERIRSDPKHFVGIAIRQGTKNNDHLDSSNLVSD